MKLLFDQNPSHRLIGSLWDLFPGSTHVRDLGMSRADDHAIWDFAETGNFTIMSKDGDFHQLAMLRGAPPKVVWLRVGNAATDEVADLMRARFDAIDAFLSGDGALMVIDP